MASRSRKLNKKTDPQEKKSKWREKLQITPKFSKEN